MRTLLVSAAVIAALSASPSFARERTDHQDRAVRTARAVTPTVAPAVVTSAKATSAPQGTRTRTRSGRAKVPASVAPLANGGGSLVTCADTISTSTCLAFEGNLNSGSAEAQLDAAIEQLLGGTSFDFDFQAVEGTGDFFTFSGDDPLGVLAFQEALFGNQILSVKVKNNTLLYLFDFGTTGATSVQLNVQGLSNALLITPPGGDTGGGGGTGAVPEPTTWAMMLLGFGGMGLAMRRRRPGTLMKQVA